MISASFSAFKKHAQVMHKTWAYFHKFIEIFFYFLYKLSEHVYNYF